MPIRKILSWTAVIIWMALIFNLSSQVAQQSNQLSKGVTKVIVKTVESEYLAMVPGTARL